MLKEFAQYIQELLIQRTDIAPALAALPQGMNTLDLEMFQDHRRRFRGVLHTHLIEAFAHYHAQQKVIGTCFINPEDMQAISYFDIGDTEAPGHCEHAARLKLKKTAELSALEDFLSMMPCDQKKLAEFIEEYRTYITATDSDGSPMDIAHVIQAVRKIEVNATAQQSSQVGNFDAAVSAMERVELQGQRLPAFIGFTCTPFFGLSERTITMRLSLITGEKPKLSLRRIAAELDQQAMAEEFQGILSGDCLPPETTINIGKFSP